MFLHKCVAVKRRVLVSSHSFVLSGKEWPIYIRINRSSVKSAPVVILLHAMMANGRSLLHPNRDSLGRCFAERGWNVIAPDFRGHGASTRGNAARSPWTYDELVSHDMPAILAHARSEFPGSALALVGHSLGGHVAAASALCGSVEEPDAWAFLAVNVWGPHVGESRRKRLTKRFVLGLFGRITTRFERFPTRWMRVGTDDEAEPYVNDLIRFARSGVWGPSGGRDYRAEGRKLQRPCLGVYGAADTVLAPYHDGTRWLEGITATDPVLWEVKQGDFGLSTAPGHADVACNPASRALWESVEGWLRGALGADEGR